MSRFDRAVVEKKKKELEEEEKARQEEEENEGPTVFVPPKTASGEEDVMVDGLAGFSDSEEEEEEMGTVPGAIDPFYECVDKNTMPMHVLPLYSLLEEKKQLQIWDPVPEGRAVGCSGDERGGNEYYHSGDQIRGGHGASEGEGVGEGDGHLRVQGM